MEHYQQYKHHINHHYPAVHNQHKNTKMTICYSSLSKLTKEIEQVDTNYTENKYFITYFQQDIGLIHDSLRAVDRCMDNFNKNGFIFKNMCPLEEKIQFMNYLKLLFRNSNYVLSYKEYMRNEEYTNDQNLKICDVLYYNIKDKIEYIISLPIETWDEET